MKISCGNSITYRKKQHDACRQEILIGASQTRPNQTGLNSSGGLLQICDQHAEATDRLIQLAGKRFAARQAHVVIKAV